MMETACYRMFLEAKRNQKSVPVDVIINQDTLSWTTTMVSKKQVPSTEIRTSDILATHPVKTGSDVLDSSMATYRIFFVQHFPNRLMRVKSVCLSMCHEDEEKFIWRITQVLKDSPKPKRLLIFINPISGRKNGVAVYRKHMAPLFRICGIEIDVIVTKRRHYVSSTLEEYDLSAVDGIVTVGGDGLFSECVNALLKNEQSRCERRNDLRCDLPVGIIPAGTGNVLVEFLHGTKDIETAVLHIIQGKTSRSNVAGLYQDQKLTVFASLVLGFGLCGEMVRDCEKMRWLGPPRLSVAPLKAFFQRRTIDMEVTQSHRQPTSNQGVQSDSTNSGKLSGHVYSLDMWVPTLVNGQKKMSPMFGDSCLSLHAVQKCSFVDHLRHLFKVNSRHTGCFDFDFVKTLQDTEYHVRLNTPHRSTRKYYINHDGEHTQLTTTSFNVRLHQNAINLFGTLQ